jgi:hypothetical protein
VTTSIAPYQPTDVPDVLHDDGAFARVERMAQLLARSQLLPAAFRGKPEDVFFAFLIAQQMGVDVFTVLQSIHFVNGKPGWAAPFLISRANASGVFTDEIKFETTGEGPSLAVTASATLKKSGERVSRTVSLAMAAADGWTKNAKYRSLPEQMLSYRAATFLIRLYCPGILYGLRPTDELEDIEATRGRPVAEERVVEVVEPEPKPRRGRKVIDATPTPEDVALAEDVAVDRANREPAVEPEVVEAPAEVVEPEAEEKPPADRHPSFTLAEQRSYSGAVSKLGMDVDTVADLAEHRGHPRPRWMDGITRGRWTRWLAKPEGREAYEQFSHYRAERAAMSEGA